MHREAAFQSPAVNDGYSPALCYKLCFSLLTWKVAFKEGQNKQLHAPTILHISKLSHHPASGNKEGKNPEGYCYFFSIINLTVDFW